MTKIRPPARMTSILRAVEAGEDRRRHHLVDGAESGAAAAEIEHAVDGAEQLVQLMGAEQDGEAELLRQAADEVDDDVLLMLVEADQRLVEQEQARAADQRLGDQQPLALAARHGRERPLGQRRAVDRLERPVDVAPRLRRGDRQRRNGGRCTELARKSRPDRPTSGGAAWVCGR